MRSQAIQSQRNAGEVKWYKCDYDGIESMLLNEEVRIKSKFTGLLTLIGVDYYLRMRMSQMRMRSLNFN